MNICEKCNKEFKYNYLLLRHEKNKKSCNLSKNLSRNELEKKINIININIITLDDKLKIHDKDIKKYVDNIIETDNKINKNNTKILKLQKKSLKIENKCYFCNKEFLNKTNLFRHIKNNCIIINELQLKKNSFIEEKNKIIENKNKIINQKKQFEDEINNIILQQKIKENYEENKKLRNKMEKIIQKQSTTNINITNNTNNTNNNKVINNNLILNINSFGKENLSHITLADYKKYLSGFFPGFIKFIEKVHFDENMPENHNINITNIKSKYLHIYENNQWTIKEKVDVLDKFINKKYNVLVDKCEELEEKKKLSEKIIDNTMQFIQNYKNKEAQNNTKNNVQIMLYNNRDKINMKQLT